MFTKDLQVELKAFKIASEPVQSAERKILSESKAAEGKAKAKAKGKSKSAK